MKILVTGASGLIGSALLRKWSADHQIVALSRTPKQAQQKLIEETPNDDFSAIEWLPSLNFFTHLDDFDAVVNLAGEPIADKRWSDTQKQRICESRWNVTQKLVDLINASSSPPQVFISGSAIGFYGRQDETPITENFVSVNQEFTHDICVKWEAIAQQANCRVCLLRTGIVLAKNGGALSKMLLPFKLGLGGKVSSGKQYMSWIHIDDMVAAIEFLLHYDAQGPFNITAPEPVTNAEFTRSLGHALKRPTLLPIPEFGLRILMGEASSLLTTGQCVTPARLLEMGFTFHYPKLDQAFSALV